MERKHKFLLVVTSAVNAAYIVWLGLHAQGPLGVVFFIAETGVSSLTFLLLFNHWSQKHDGHATRLHRADVDVFLTIVDEPLSIFEPVLASAVAIDYPSKTVFVLDDGARPEVRALAGRYGATYLARPDRPKNFKAGNLNGGLAHAKGDYVLVIDADQKVTDPKILAELVGHFAEDDKLAIVSTRQSFDVPHLDFNHDVLFYEHMQAGKNDDNATISCGSGVIYARAALDAIGGFQTWNIVEDLYTSYVLHRHGYGSLYVNKCYTIGTAPMDLAAVYKQRGTWATDTLRLFFRKNPLFAKGLSFRQRMHYSELALAYLVSAFAITTLFTLPIVTLALRIAVVDDPARYVFFRIPSLALILLLYYRLSGNTFSTSQFWASLFPVYLKSTFLALRPGKPLYKVTPKVGTGKRDTLLALPHFAMIGAAAAVTAHYLVRDGLDYFLGVHLVWFALMAFWFWPLIQKAVRKE